MAGAKPAPFRKGPRAHLRSRASTTQQHPHHRGGVLGLEAQGRFGHAWAPSRVRPLDYRGWVRRQRCYGLPELDRPPIPHNGSLSYPSPSASRLGAPCGVGRSTALPAAPFAFPVPLSDMEISFLPRIGGAVALQRDTTLDHKGMKRRMHPKTYKPEESHDQLIKNWNLCRIFFFLHKKQKGQQLFGVCGLIQVH